MDPAATTESPADSATHAQHTPITPSAAESLTNPATTIPLTETTSSGDPQDIATTTAVRSSAPPSPSDEDVRPESCSCDQSSSLSPLRKQEVCHHHQLVDSLDGATTSSDTASLPESSQISLEDSRRLAAVSKPSLPDSDLSATSDLVDGRSRTSVSAGSGTSSPVAQPDEVAANACSQPECANGQSTLATPSAREENTGSCETDSNRNGGQPPAGGGTATPPGAAAQSDVVVHIDDISLHSRSTSPPEEVKVHPLSVLRSCSTSPLEEVKVPLSVVTSDSEVDGEELDHSHSRYSRVPDPTDPPTEVDDQSTQSGQDSFPTISPPSSPLSMPESEDPAIQTILFPGISYLGSSAVDAPVSEIEANRKMHVLKEQAEGTEPIPVVLSIPVMNLGSVVLRDPKSDQPMATYAIRQILFCARGNAEILLDCFCLNVRNKRSGMYQCHVFKCSSNLECDKVFKAIGKAFTTKSLSKPQSPLTEDSVLHEFLMSLDIHEEDSKGIFVPVHMDKDCFKLRLQTRRKLTLTVSQPSSETSILIMRCFGMLVAAGKDIKNTDMDLLDNMNPSPNGGPTFSVSGIWEQGVSFLSAFNEETPKSARSQYLTVAADLILEGVTEPVRFRREVKVSVSRGGMVSGFSAGTILNQFTTHKRKPGPMDHLLYTLRLAKNEVTKDYVVVSLLPSLKLKQASVETGGGVAKAAEEGYRRTPSPTRIGRSGSLRGSKPAESSGRATPTTGSPKNPEEESDNEEEDDVVYSGWGDVEGMKEELLKDWGEVLERWDGRDRVRPSKVVKLCRKGIPRHMRCQVWQMLTGAAHDPQLLEAYRLLLVKDSPAENVINWDIKRTYVGHDYFQEEGNKAALYKISKAYSIYDEEVGYCQGFSFMAAVLLLQKMPEETAFSVLVKIMYAYGHRNLFKANFQDLHLMFFQLEKLMEENLPDLHEHMAKNRIETHMYASQWFLTLYTAKFPLSIVFRILDIYLCERIGVIFLVALALLKIAKKDLLTLDFEGILNYFRVSLPKRFQTEADCQLLFHTMFSFKVSEKKLGKLERDYQSYKEQQAQLEDPVIRLERDNKQLRDTIHRLEQENDNLAEDLVGSKIKLRSEMDKLEEKIDMLSKECRTHKASRDDAHGVIHDLREELKQAKDEFQRVMMKLTEERLQHDGAIQEYKQVFRKLDEGHQKQKEDLNRELLEVKAQLGGTEEAGMSSLSSEQRLRNLELELAQTKLALVESQCKNQELEHKIVELTSSKSRRWDFGKKK